MILSLTVILTAQCVPVFVGTREASDKSSNSPGSPAPSTGALETADQVIDRYVQALGGAQALSGITSVEAKGTFEMPEAGMTGTVVYYFKAPNLSATTLRTSDNNYGVLRVFDGTNGWERTRNSMGEDRARQITGSELQAQKVGGDFTSSLKLKQLYRSKTFKGRQKLEEKEVFVIEAVSVTGEPEELYFDTETGLLLRKDYVESSSRGNRKAQSYFEDYRAVTGAANVKAPYTTSTFYPDDDQGNHIIRFTEFRANAPVNDSIFAPPRN